MAKIILTTGGTGGHIFPALAVAQELTRNKHDLLFVGSNYGPERRLAEKNGLPFAGLPVRGLLGKGLRAIPAVLDMAAALARAYALMGKFRPDIVAGFGGYASFAPMLAGAMRRIPILLQEQNAIAGTSNRILARFASTVCVSLPNTKGFSGQTVITGNPVRKEIGRLTRRQARDTKHLLILGGSQGAHALNERMCKILDKLEGVEIRHQCGVRDLESTRAAYRAHGFPEECVSAFIDDMAESYAWADLALCRSGASTTAELCAAGLPSLLVPFPAAIHDHQTFNGRVLAEAGAAILVPEDELEPVKMVEIILNLLNDPEKRQGMAEAAGKLAKPDAAGLVAKEIEKLCAKLYLNL